MTVGCYGGGWSEQSRVLVGCKDLPRYLGPDRGDCQGTVGDQPGMVRKQLQMERELSRIAGWEIVRITLVGKTEMRERSTKGLSRRAEWCSAFYAVLI